MGAGEKNGEKKDLMFVRSSGTMTASKQTKVITITAMSLQYLIFLVPTSDVQVILLGCGASCCS